MQRDSLISELSEQKERHEALEKRLAAEIEGLHAADLRIEEERQIGNRIAKVSSKPLTREGLTKQSQHLETARRGLLRSWLALLHWRRKEPMILRLVLFVWYQRMCKEPTYENAFVT